MANKVQQKYYFPDLKKAIVKKGWTMEEFKAKARNLSTKGVPSSRGWSLLTKKNNGMTETYCIKAKKKLKALKFDDDVREYVKVTK